MFAINSQRVLHWFIALLLLVLGYNSHAIVSEYELYTVENFMPYRLLEGDALEDNYKVQVPFLAFHVSEQGGDAFDYMHSSYDFEVLPENKNHFRDVMLPELEQRSWSTSEGEKEVLILGQDVANEEFQFSRSTLNLLVVIVDDKVIINYTQVPNELLTLLLPLLPKISAQ